MHERGICVIIPTYNNEGTIADVIDRTLLFCQDVIVVNDGCTDTSAAYLPSRHDIILVDNTSNRGKGYALKDGFLKAISLGFTYAITMDADGQHYPEDIPLFLEANRRNPRAIIMGQRNLNGVRRNAASRFANSFSNFWFALQTLHPLADTQTGYRLYPLKRLWGINLLTSRYEAELELIVLASWHGVDIVSQKVNVFYPSPEQRVSHFRPALDFTRISILNTILCVLAIVYALPLALLRLLRCILYSLYSLLFYIIATLGFMLPMAIGFLLVDRKGKSATWHLHLMLWHMANFVIQRHGIPGVRYTLINSSAETFDKPAVIICNHQSYIDLMAMLALTPKIILLTNDWVWRSPFFGYVIRHAQYLPLSDGLDNIMPRLRQLVSEGYSIAVYPEGTRSADCEIQRFRSGAFHIARQLDLDIIPLILYGSGKVLPKRGKYLRRGPVVMEVENRLPAAELKQAPTSQRLAVHFHKFYQKRYRQLSNMVERLLILFAAVFFTLTVSVQVQAARTKTHIWRGTRVHAPSVTLTPYIPTSTTITPNPSTRTAVIVCPGGSYSWHDRWNESTLLAQYLSQQGIATFVLNYRVQGMFQYGSMSRAIFGGHKHPDMICDLQRSIQYLREHAREFGIDSARIGVIGFSAGGHLALSSAVFCHTDFLAAKGIRHTVSLRPDFVAAIYPVVTMKAPYVHRRSRRALLGEYGRFSRKLRDSLSLERHIPQDCPPVFVVNCKDDPVVNFHNSVLLDSALTKKGIVHTYIQYNTGKHGFGASDTKGTPESRQWKSAFLSWLSNL